MSETAVIRLLSDAELPDALMEPREVAFDVAASARQGGLVPSEPPKWEVPKKPRTAEWVVTGVEDCDG